MFEVGWLEARNEVELMVEFCWVMAFGYFEPA